MFEGVDEVAALFVSLDRRRITFLFLTNGRSIMVDDAGVDGV